MNFDPNNRMQATYSTATKEFDVGLQAHMRNVYNMMTVGLVLTGLVAWSVANIEPVFNLIFGTPLAWVAMLAPLAFIFFGFTPKRISRMPSSKVTTLFYVFSALMGISMASIFYVYSGQSIARVFFITAGMFAGTSLYGYTTKKNLAGMGSFMMMGLIGIIIAGFVNMIVGSAMVHFVTSILGVIIFTGLTAWDTQNIKESYAVSHGHEANSKRATMGALSLYLNFVLLFQHLMSLMGER